jgi:hypothetical protein
MAGAFVALAELGAEQHPTAEPQLLEVGLDGQEVVVVELAGQHGEQPPEPLRLEASGLAVSEGPEPLEDAHEQL